MAHLVAFARDPTGTLERIARDWGDVAFFRFGGRPEVLVSHPDLVEEVLVTEQRAFVKGRALNEARRVLGDGLLTSEGERHLHDRRVIQPLFHNRVLDRYADEIVAVTRDAIACWPERTAVDLHDELMRVTLAIIARSVFGIDIGGADRTVGHALDVVLRLVSNRVALPGGAVLYHLPLPGTLRFRRSMSMLDRTVEHLIGERRRAGLGGRDLVSLLVGEQPAAGLDDRGVRDHALTMLLAGHETTAVWLTWAIHLLGGRPDLVDEILAEVEACAAGRPLAAGDVGALAATDAVLREALRLYPPVWLIGRRARHDVVIGGRTIPAGTIVVCSQWVVHRDPRWFADPTAFRPERWRDGSAADLRGSPSFPSVAAFAAASERDSPGWRRLSCSPNSSAHVVSCRCGVRSHPCHASPSARGAACRRWSSGGRRRERGRSPTVCHTAAIADLRHIRVRGAGVLAALLTCGAPATVDAYRVVAAEPPYSQPVVRYWVVPALAPHVERAVGAIDRAGVGIRLVRVPTRAGANIVIGYNRRLRCIGTLGVGGVLRRDLGRALVAAGCAPQVTQWAVAHELGHALGLLHESRACATMNPVSLRFRRGVGTRQCGIRDWIRGPYRLDDLRGLRRIYGAR